MTSFAAGVLMRWAERWRNEQNNPGCVTLTVTRTG